MREVEALERLGDQAGGLSSTAADRARLNLVRKLPGYGSEVKSPEGLEAGSAAALNVIAAAMNQPKSERDRIERALDELAGAEADHTRVLIEIRDYLKKINVAALP